MESNNSLNLTQCYQCGGLVSKEAERCPHCGGFPTKAQSDFNRSFQRAKGINSISNTFLIIGLIGLMVAFVLYIMFL